MVCRNHVYRRLNRELSEVPRLYANSRSAAYYCAASLKVFDTVILVMNYEG